MEKIVPKETLRTFRGDRLGCAGTITSENELIKNKLFNMLTKWGLRIKNAMDQSRVDYLDLTMEFYERSYKSYVKPRTKIKCVNKQSDHWELAVKHVPKVVQHMLKKSSRSREMFDQ